MSSTVQRFDVADLPATPWKSPGKQIALPVHVLYWKSSHEAAESRRLHDGNRLKYSIVILEI